MKMKTIPKAVHIVYFVVVAAGLGTMIHFSLNDRKSPIIISEPSPIIIKEHQSTTFEATGYAIGHPYSTITKLGQPVINRSFMQVGGIDIFTIAVDPKVIPLGSLVYIDGLGLALATDTGKAIKGRLIDICFTTMDDAMEWGRKDVRVYMLRRAE